MNIFVLDKNPKLAAQYHCDKHVVKMCLETAQILCSVRHKIGNKTEIPYRLTHKNHPCVIWCSEHEDNYTWVYNLGIELCNEYTYRYGKKHKSLEVIKDSGAAWWFLNFPNIKNPFVQAMSDYCKNEDPVVAYRTYYIKEKRHLAKWTKRSVPFWWIN